MKRLHYTDQGNAICPNCGGKMDAHRLLSYPPIDVWQCRSPKCHTSIKMDEVYVEAPEPSCFERNVVRTLVELSDKIDNITKILSNGCSPVKMEEITGLKDTTLSIVNDESLY